MKLKNYTISILTPDEIDRANEIYKIMEENLLTPKVFYQLKPSEKEQFSKNGFVIGYHDLNNIKSWIKDEENNIFVVKNLDLEGNPIIGYTILLSNEYIIKEVQDYSKETRYNDDFSEEIIKSGEFKYLIQIAVSRDYQNFGFGSKIFNKIFKEMHDPIISYVIKSPILNQISLYIHLKLGFTYMGTFLGNYTGTKNDKFNDYQSIGLIHMNDAKPLQNKDDVLKLMKEII